VGVRSSEEISSKAFVKTKSPAMEDDCSGVWFNNFFVKGRLVFQGLERFSGLDWFTSLAGFAGQIGFDFKTFNTFWFLFSII
jgi:hypothetical protein